jgi:MOSC domain-containing protein YiiM
LIVAAKGRLIGIAIKRKPREPMELLERVEISLERGLEGDVRGAIPDHQVTIVFKDGWEAACADLGREVHWTARRANLFVDGVSVPKSVGAKVRLGRVLLEVTDETQPCMVMEMQAKGLRAALLPEWRGGVTCRVLESGTVKTGERVEIIPAKD